MIEQIFQHLNVFIGAKNKNHRYIFCNENFAEAAGLDSPNQIRDKYDKDLAWRNQKELYEYSDNKTLNGEILTNYPEIQTKFDGNTIDVLTCKNQLKNNIGDMIGVVLSYVDCTGYQLIKKSGVFNTNNKNFFEFTIGGHSIVLSKSEYGIFRCLISGMPSSQISILRSISKRTVENYIENIRYKLQCDSKWEIVNIAIRNGLTYLIDDEYDL